jgi:hypothetical protein
MGYLVALAHRHGSVYLHMKIDVIMDAHLAHETFVQIDHAGNGARGDLNAIDDLTARCGIENFRQRGPKQTRARGGNDGAGKERRIGIGPLPFFSAEQGNGDSEECRGGSDGVGPVMPGVGGDGSAFERAAGAIHKTKKCFLNNDDADEHDEGERRGSVMWAENFAHTLECDNAGRGQHSECDKDGGKRLSFAVTVGMGCIGWARGISQTTPDDDRARDIERGLDPVGDERVGIPENAASYFRNCEDHIDAQTQESEMGARPPDGRTRPVASLEIARSSVAARMIIHGEGND